MKELIQAVLVEPGQPARRVLIENDRDGIRSLIGGMGLSISHPWDDEVALLCHAYNWSHDPMNRVIIKNDNSFHSMVSGKFLLVKHDVEGMDFESLPKELVRKYLLKFSVPDTFNYLDNGLLEVNHHEIHEERIEETKNKEENENDEHC